MRREDFNGLWLALQMIALATIGIAFVILAAIGATVVIEGICR